jgi:hypothetical protein
MPPIIYNNLSIRLKEAVTDFYDVGKVHAGLWWRNMTEIDHLENPGIDGEDNMKMNVQEVRWGHGLAWCGSG